MDRIVKQCIKCNLIIGCCKESDLIHTGQSCNGKLKTLNISWDELSTIEDISSDKTFLQAMIDLKESDPIEFQLKMSQFKTNLSQTKQAEESRSPHCPHCKSTNIKPIGGLERVGSITMWGLFSKKINKSFECLSCKYTW